jgi:ABC-type transport system involved in multi-copper enzyme maturation permease subunit
MQQRMERGNVARLFALAIGLGYVAAGVVGFAVTGFTGPVVLNTDDALLGFFDLNIFHNIVHLAIGLGLIVAWRVRDVAITQGVLIGVGLFYLVAAGLGFLNYLQLISINSSLSFDNFFHLLTGVVALIFGLIGVRQQDDSVPAMAGVERSRY